MTSFYQGGRGSSFRGKWIIPSQISRGRWRISRMWRLILPFKWEIGGRKWRVSRIWRLVLPFKWEIGGRKWRVSHIWRLVLPFKWTYFPNTGPRERLSTLSSWQCMEGRILSLGDFIQQYLLNRSSPSDCIQGILSERLHSGKCRSLPG